MVGFGDFGASIGGSIGTIDDAVSGMTGASAHRVEPAGAQLTAHWNPSPCRFVTLAQ